MSFFRGCFYFLVIEIGGERERGEGGPADLTTTGGSLGVGSGGGALAAGLLTAAGGVVTGRNLTKLSGNIPIFPFFFVPSHQPSSTCTDRERQTARLLECEKKISAVFAMLGTIS